MFNANIETIKIAATEYIGSGMYIALFLVAILYIFIKEENRNIKFFLGWFSITIFIIILNPIFAKLVENVFTKSVYWRFFWMLPIGITMAYVGTKVVMFRKKISGKVITSICLILIIMISGKFIYSEENYKKVDNAYKLPDEAVHVAYILENDEKKYKKVMLPTELVPYIRQINGNINLMYARNPQGYENNELIQEFENGNLEYVVTKCRSEYCNYIIFNKATQLNSNMSDYGFNLLAQTENYDIYVLSEDLEK